jgi:hypothetical protein
MILSTAVCQIPSTFVIIFIQSLMKFRRQIRKLCGKTQITCTIFSNYVGIYIFKIKFETSLVAFLLIHGS